MNLVRSTLFKTNLKENDFKNEHDILRSLPEIVEQLHKMAMFNSKPAVLHAEKLMMNTIAEINGVINATPDVEVDEAYQHSHSANF